MQMSKNLLGIMQLDTKVNITASTTSVKTTFKVTDNGTTVIYDDSADGLLFDSGPFSVKSTSDLRVMDYCHFHF